MEGHDNQVYPWNVRKATITGSGSISKFIKVWGVTDRSEILLDLDGHLFKLRRSGHP